METGSGIRRQLAVVSIHRLVVRHSAKVDAKAVNGVDDTLEVVDRIRCRRRR